jgi:hypothetical protein
MPMPANTPSQSYSNHVRRLPAPYVAACLVLALAAAGALAEIVLRPSILAAALLLAVAAAGIFAWYVRINALIVQNRVIRLEERLRLARLLPAELAGRIDELDIRQLVALRFASDGELVELVRAVLDGRLVGADAIKRAVRDWRGDWLRV